MSLAYKLEKLPVPIKDLLLRNRRRGNVVVGTDCLIKNSSLEGKITVGEKCKLIGVRLKGEVTLGRYTSIFGPACDAYSLLNSISIGSFCSIARGVKIQEYNHNIDCPTTYFIKANMFNDKSAVEQISSGPITVGSDVWIGADSLILSGTSIGTGAIVAANSVVTKDVPPYTIVGGSPAKHLRHRFDLETIEYLLKLRWWELPAEELQLNKEFFSCTGSPAGTNRVRDYRWKRI